MNQDIKFELVRTTTLMEFKEKEDSYLVILTGNVKSMEVTVKKNGELLWLFKPMRSMYVSKRFAEDRIKKAIQNRLTKYLK